MSHDGDSAKAGIQCMGRQLSPVDPLFCLTLHCAVAVSCILHMMDHMMADKIGTYDCHLVKID